ncbi:MAG: cation:proton antiporter [Dehalococcoidia bacterium]|nr:cation:proton antiporter [Dehalococcoidia bacterium]
MEEFQLLTSVAIALGLALAGGVLARFAGLSPIVGYLAAGVAISPFTPGYDADLRSIRELAELGVIFLMFGVGLHFNVRDLLSVRAIAVPGAIIQVTLATAAGAGVGLAFGLGGREALVLGLAMSIASTVVLIRTLEDRGLLQSVHGRVVVGWLVAQDIITVLVLAILPTLEPGQDGDVPRKIAIAILRAGVFVAVMLLVGARLVPRLLSVIARTGSRELFILAFVAGALGIATSAAAFGLSVALGAFIAGVVVSETETSHQVAADVVPLRDAFAVLFFVSVGMLLDPGIVAANLGLFVAVTAVVLFANAAIAFLTAAAFPYSGRTALTVGAGLAQLGEFSFIIADESLELGLMDSATYNVVLAAAVVSISLNPLAFTSLPRLERVLRKVPLLWQLIDRQGEVPEPELPRDGHVVIIGYGRVGELVGHALAQIEVPFAVVESDLNRVRQLAAAGIAATWGDAGRHEVLDRVHVPTAIAVVVAVPDESTALVATAAARERSAVVPILVRARSGGEIATFLVLGASEVVVPEYEGGLELMRQALIAIGSAPEKALQLSHAMRDVHYESAGHV